MFGCWTYGIELWGCSSKSNVDIIQRFQSKTLRMITGAPWYVSNQSLHTDLRIPTVEEERLNRIDKHFQRLQFHVNQLANNLAAVRNPKKGSSEPGHVIYEDNKNLSAGQHRWIVVPPHAITCDIPLAHRTDNFICIVCNWF